MKRLGVRLVFLIALLSPMVIRAQDPIVEPAVQQGESQPLHTLDQAAPSPPADERVKVYEVPNQPRPVPGTEENCGDVSGEGPCGPIRGKP